MMYKEELDNFDMKCIVNNFVRIGYIHIFNSASNLYIIVHNNLTILKVWG